MKYLARFAIGICILTGGLWFHDFIEHPNKVAAMWVGLAIILIALNIRDAKIGEVINA